MSAYNGKALANPLLISLLGAATGVGLFLILTLPFKYASVVLAAIALTVLALVARQWKWFFLGCLILGVPVQLKKTVYPYSLDHIGGPGGVDILLADCALFALYIHWVLTSVTRRHERLVRFSTTDALVMLSITVSGLSLLGAGDLTLGVVDFIRMIKVGLIYFYLANNIKDVKELKFIVLGLMVGLVINDAISMAQYLLGRPLGLAFLGELKEFNVSIYSDESRPSGVMPSANTSALYVVSVLPYVFTSLFWLKSRLLKAFSLSTFASGLFTLVITLSRGTWVAFLCTVPVMLFLLIKKHFIAYRRHFHIFVLISLLCLAIVGFLYPKIMDRLLNTPNIPIYTRVFLNNLSFDLFSSHPFAGVGLNNFAETARDVIRTIPDPHNIFDLVVDNPVAHNLYLFIAVETGVVGLMSFMLIVFALAMNARQLLRLSDPFLSTFGIATLSFFVSFAVAEMFDFSYRLDQVFYLFWTLAGLIVASGRIGERLGGAQETGSA